MATRVRNPLISLLTAFLLRLRFPYLFAISLALFALNLIVPDPIPFIDELMLGLLAALLASLQGKGGDGNGDGGGPQSRVTSSGAGPNDPRKGGAS